MALRNALYIAAGCPATWRAEVKLSVPGEVTVVADAIYSIQAGQYNIVEVDHTQKMAANRAKIARYRHLCGLGVFTKPPKFTWLTTTEFRRKQLVKLCEGLNARVYTLADLN